MPLLADDGNLKESLLHGRCTIAPTQNLICFELEQVGNLDRL
jgi:hypothetical protein